METKEKSFAVSTTLVLPPSGCLLLWKCIKSWLDDHPPPGATWGSLGQFTCSPCQFGATFAAIVLVIRMEQSEANYTNCYGLLQPGCT